MRIMKIVGLPFEQKAFHVEFGTEFRHQHGHPKDPKHWYQCLPEQRGPHIGVWVWTENGPRVFQNGKAIHSVSADVWKEYSEYGASVTTTLQAWSLNLRSQDTEDPHVNLSPDPSNFFQRVRGFPASLVRRLADELTFPAFPFHKSVTRCLKLLLVPWSYDHRACYMLIETSKLKSTRKQNGNLPMTLGSSHWSSWPCNANSLATTKCQIGIKDSSIDLAKNQDISPSDSHEPNKNDQSPSDLHPIHPQT